MGQRDAAGEALARRRQAVAHVAEDEVVAGGNAGGMGRDITLEHVDLPPGQALAQVIEGAAVAKPQFENDPLDAADQGGGMIEAGALRLKAPDGAVEPAHGRLRFLMRESKLGRAPTAPAGHDLALATLMLAAYVTGCGETRRRAMADENAGMDDLARSDGLWTALALFVAVLFFLGVAAYLYWSGTGKLPWA